MEMVTLLVSVLRVSFSVEIKRLVLRSWIPAPDTQLVIPGGAIQLKIIQAVILSAVTALKDSVRNISSAWILMNVLLEVILALTSVEIKKVDMIASVQQDLNLLKMRQHV